MALKFFRGAPVLFLFCCGVVWLEHVCLGIYHGGLLDSVYILSVKNNTTITVHSLCMHTSPSALCAQLEWYPHPISLSASFYPPPLASLTEVSPMTIEFFACSLFSLVLLLGVLCTQALSLSLSLSLSLCVCVCVCVCLSVSLSTAPGY